MLGKYSEEYLNIDPLELKNEAIEDITDQIKYLLEELSVKKRDTEDKYKKLLEVQTDLIEVHTKMNKESKDTEYISQLEDENNYLKNELTRARTIRL